MYILLIKQLINRLPAYISMILRIYITYIFIQILYMSIYKMSRNIELIFSSQENLIFLIFTTKNSISF